MSIVLPIVFFLIAIVFSMVGLGGGSGYIAAMIFLDIPHFDIPLISLVCNIIVVASASFYILKAKLLKFKLLAPFIITSMPFAYLGGRLEVSKTFFLALLGSCLLIAGIRMFYSTLKKDSFQKPENTSKIWIYGPISGSIMGFVSGIVGIGGGIFLGPLMYFFKVAKPKRIAACTSFFILINSILALLGQIQKLATAKFFIDYIWLFIAAILGAQLGSYLLTIKLSQLMVKRLLSLLILASAIKLFFEI